MFKFRDTASILFQIHDINITLTIVIEIFFKSIFDYRIEKLGINNADERHAFAARCHSNFSVVINKDFSITTRTSVIADTGTLSRPVSTRGFCPFAVP